ncbi:hypothetical protein ACR6C2_02830 [Streptomyces sp. INA 01156]
MKRFDSVRTSRNSVAYEIWTPSRMRQKPSVNFMIFLGGRGGGGEREPDLTRNYDRSGSSCHALGEEIPRRG